MLVGRYNVYQCKHIGIPTCKQHLLNRTVRLPDDDRLKRSKHVASYKIKYLHLTNINPLNAELNPICHLLALLGARHILHVSGVRVN